MKKITLATIKSFTKKNFDNLHIKIQSDFNGMVDMVEQYENARFVKIEKTERSPETTLGINGVWIVRGSRDLFTKYEDEEFEGYEVYNCCGSFVLAIKK